MGFHIGLATRKDGKMVEVPHSKWPAPGWDHARLGWDHEYLSDLWKASGPGQWLDVYESEDDSDGCDHECFRPPVDEMERLRDKYPANLRLARILDLLEADASMMFFVT